MSHIRIAKSPEPRPPPTPASQKTVLKALRESSIAPLVMLPTTAMSPVVTEWHAPVADPGQSVFTLSLGELGPETVRALPREFERSTLFVQGEAFPPSAREAVLDTLKRAPNAAPLKVLISDGIRFPEETVASFGEAFPFHSSYSVLWVDLLNNQARLAGGNVGKTPEVIEAAEAVLDTIETSLGRNLDVSMPVAPPVIADTSKLIEALESPVDSVEETPESIEPSVITRLLEQGRRSLQVELGSDGHSLVLSSRNGKDSLVIEAGRGTVAQTDGTPLTPRQLNHLERLLVRSAAPELKEAQGHVAAAILERAGDFAHLPPEELPLSLWRSGTGFVGDSSSVIEAYRDHRFNPEIRRYDTPVYETGEFPEEKKKSELQEHLEDWRGLKGKPVFYDAELYFNPRRNSLWVNDTLHAEGKLLPEHVQQSLTNCYWMAALHASLAVNPDFVNQAVEQVPLERLQKKYPNLAPELREVPWYEVTLFPRGLFGPQPTRVWVNGLTNQHLSPMQQGYRVGERPDRPMSVPQMNAVIYEKAFAVFQGSYAEHTWGNSRNALVNMHGTEGHYLFTDLKGPEGTFRTLRRNLRQGNATVAVAYDVRGNLEGSLGKFEFLLKLVKERDPGDYGVTDQHCYSVVEARVETQADGTKEKFVYVRNPRLYNNRDGMPLPERREGKEWEAYLERQLKLPLKDFHEAYTFLTYARVPH